MRNDLSVAEILSRAHEALQAELRKLEQAVSPSSREGLVEIRARLAAARTHIAEHFRVEEENGYLHALKDEPRLERAVHQLAKEHGQLSQLLDRLLGEARVAPSLGDTLREEIAGWIERLRQHEHRENDLVQGTLNMDIGAED
jgi:hypothetical protein